LGKLPRRIVLLGGKEKKVRAKARVIGTAKVKGVNLETLDLAGIPGKRKLPQTAVAADEGREKVREARLPREKASQRSPQPGRQHPRKKKMRLTMRISRSVRPICSTF